MKYIIPLIAVIVTSPILHVQLNAQAISVELQSHDESLRVILINNSHGEIRVNKRLAYGRPKESGVDLNFIIKNNEGESYNFQSLVNRRTPKESDWCYLLRNQFIGRIIPLYLIKADYALKSGEFYIQAKYTMRNDDGKVLTEIESNTIKITFTEDMKLEGGKPKGQAKKEVPKGSGWNGTDLREVVVAFARGNLHTKNYLTN